MVLKKINIGITIESIEILSKTRLEFRRPIMNLYYS